MKKILSLIMVFSLSLVAMAQSTLTSQPQGLKAQMAKEHLSNKLQKLEQPAQNQQRVDARQSADWATFSAAKAPAQTAGLDTTEVYFSSFYDDPYFYEQIGRAHV